MYAIYERNGKLIAIHDERDVIEEFHENLMRSHNEEYNNAIIKKVHYKKLKSKMPDCDDYYLLRYGDTYIQLKYFDYLSIISDQDIHDTKFAMDILIKLLMRESLTNKERKTIEKTIFILQDILHADSSYTPNMDEMEHVKSMYEPYMMRR